MFSKACEYGIRATIYIAMQSKDGKRASLKDIAERTNSPVAFTAKILQTLTKHKVIDSVKGAAGGFEINPVRMSKIRLSEVVTAIDGDNIYRGCGLGLPACSERRPCPVHDRFARIREELRIMLESTTINELATDAQQGITYLRR